MSSHRCSKSNIDFQITILIFYTIKKVTLDTVVENLKNKVFEFEKHHDWEIDRESYEVRIRTTYYTYGYFGHVEWIAEVATYLELTLSARVIDNEVVLVIH